MEKLRAYAEEKIRRAFYVRGDDLSDSEVERLVDARLEDLIDMLEDMLEEKGPGFWTGG